MDNSTRHCGCRLCCALRHAESLQDGGMVIGEAAKIIARCHPDIVSMRRVRNYLSGRRNGGLS